MCVSLVSVLHNIFSKYCIYSCYSVYCIKLFFLSFYFLSLSLISGQWASKNYPPPPSSRPPRLPVSNVRSPSSSTSSSSGSEGTIIMKGQLNLGGENSRLPVPGEWGGREWRVGGGGQG